MDKETVNKIIGSSTPVVKLKKEIKQIIPYLYKYRDVQQGSKCREVITARIHKIEDLLRDV
tara:strand:- start:827 stop:1009 length:183 start_codon:yes stop_codon:yes gene_type:complete